MVKYITSLIFLHLTGSPKHWSQFIDCWSLTTTLPSPPCRQSTTIPNPSLNCEPVYQISLTQRCCFLIICFLPYPHPRTNCAPVSSKKQVGKSPIACTASAQNDSRTWESIFLSFVTPYLNNFNIPFLGDYNALACLLLCFV